MNLEKKKGYIEEVALETLEEQGKKHPKLHPQDKFITDEEGNLVKIVVAGTVDDHKLEPIEAYDQIIQRRKIKSSTMSVLNRLPWKISIFLFGVFIIVFDLHITGWNSFLASGFTKIINLSNSDLADSVIATFLIGTVSVIVVNILNNQPATILMASIMRELPFQTVEPLAQTGAIYSLIIASNLGANFTLVGALAGILWSTIMASKNVKITYLEFLSYGIRIMPFVVFAAFGTLSLELIVYATFIRRPDPV